MICHDAIAAQDAVYETEQVRSIALAPLNGASFQCYNARVYGIIKQLVLEGGQAVPLSSVFTPQREKRERESDG